MAPALPCVQTDLASEAELAEVEAEIRRINAEAGITRCQRCQIDLARILNTGLYSASTQAAAGREPPATSGSGSGEGQHAGASEGGAPAGAGEAGCSPEQQAQVQGEQEQPACGSDGSRGPPCDDPQCSDPHHHHHSEHSSVHDARIGTVTIHLPGAPLDLPSLRRWLDTLLWEGTADAADLFRIKGLLHVAGSARKHILQGGRHSRRCGGALAGGGLHCQRQGARFSCKVYPSAVAQAGIQLSGCHLQQSKSTLRTPPPPFAAGVHEIYDIVEGPEWAAGEQRSSKLVFIGRRLRRGALAADLAACQAQQ